MKHRFFTRLLPSFMLFAIACMLACARAQDTGPAASLKAAYARLKPRLENSPYKNPIWLDSTQEDSAISGEVYGTLNRPFSAIRKNLHDPVGWCEVLFLHLNVKYCKALNDSTIEIYAGTKKPQSLEAATRMRYRFTPVADQPGYLKVAMTAAQGPYGTSDYVISMEAVPINAGQSFIRVAYGYRYGIVASLAMKTYLSTIGSDKEGLSIVGRKSDGSLEYASGMRGVIERNTLRYYLAITAYLDSLSAPASRQLETRLLSWFDATENYPQLREISRKDYLGMKRDEYRRMKKKIPEMSLAS